MYGGQRNEEGWRELMCMSLGIGGEKTGARPRKERKA
jgi:hypothetical protein